MELIKKDSQHIIRLYPTVYLSTESGDSTLNQFLDDYKFIAKINDNLTTTVAGVDDKGDKYFDIEIAPERLMELTIIQSVVSVQSRNEKLECVIEPINFSPAEIVNMLAFVYKDTIVCKLFSQLEVLKNVNVSAKIAEQLDQTEEFNMSTDENGFVTFQTKPL